LRFSVNSMLLAKQKTKSKTAIRLIWIIHTFGQQNSWDVE